MTTYTADDFKTATIATRGTLGVARRLADHDILPWLIDGEDWEDDEGMVECGWNPVREATGPEPHNAYLKANDVFRTKVEHLEGLLDEATSANESLRARNTELESKIERLEERLEEESELARRLLIRNASLNGEVATLSRLVQDAKDAPLTLDSLREAWEGAEVPTAADPIREGDTLIRFDPDDGAVDAWECKTGYHPAAGITRVLHRAPQPEPWQDLADVLGRYDLDAVPDQGADILARHLHRDGVRVTEGDESNE